MGRKKKKPKKIKKPKVPWSKEERKQKMGTIRFKIVSLEINMQFPDEMRLAELVMKKYIEIGEHIDFKIKLPGSNRIMELTLYKFKPLEPCALLKYKEGV